MDNRSLELKKLDEQYIFVKKKMQAARELHSNFMMMEAKREHGEIVKRLNELPFMVELRALKIKEMENKP